MAIQTLAELFLTAVQEHARDDCFSYRTDAGDWHDVSSVDALRRVQALRHGLRVTDVPVSYRRRVGVSKIIGTVKGTVLAGYKIIWTVLRYSVRP